LNLVYNPNRDTEYPDTEVLESVALNQYADVLTESVSPEQSAFRMVEEAVVSNASKAAKAARKAMLNADKLKKAKKVARGDAVNTWRANYGDKLNKALAMNKIRRYYNKELPMNKFRQGLQNINQFKGIN
jgi:hypothetical protein